MLTGEPRYTLKEAQHKLNEQECAKAGHSFDLVLDAGGSPKSIECHRCGRGWQIGEERK